MARKVFISFLGTNDYVECYYEIKGTDYLSVSTRFFQEALIDYLCKDWTSNDEIIIFGTEGAMGSKAKNWHDGGQKRNEEDKPSKGLQSVLKSKNLQVKWNDLTIIPEGFSEDEIWKIFNIIFEKLHSEDEIYFDVTHAFRSIPMFSIILFNYAQFLKNTKVVSIFYGAFEKLGPAFEVKNLPLEKRIAPILDLMPLVNLQNWIKASSDFIDYGKMDKIHELLEEKYKLLNRISFGKNEDAKTLTNLDKKLINHTQSIISNKLSAIILGTDISKELEAVKNAQESISPAFTPLIVKIEEKLRKFNLNNLNNVFAATDWCIEHELFQNAYSILLEGTISIILDKIEEKYEGSEPYIEAKRGIVTYVADSKRMISKECCICNLRITDKLIDKTDELKDIVSKVWDILDDNISAIIRKLNTTRNAFMHAGTGTNSLSNFASLKTIINECYAALSNWYKQIPPLDSQLLRLFINLSNHPSTSWSPEQLAAAQCYGKISDLPFPEVDPDGDERYIQSLVKDYMNMINSQFSTLNSQLFVHVMGEMTFTFAMINALQKQGITCVASTTERVAMEENGVKTSEFRFKQFRKYEMI